MTNELKTINGSDGWKVSLYQDDFPDSPREWDNVGKLVLFHKRYTLAQEMPELGKASDYNGWDEVEAAIEERAPGAIVLPVSMYDHSGVSLSIGRASGWDAGQVGFAVLPPARFVEAGLGNGETEAIRAWGVRQLTLEVETYSQYLNGEVYGYVVEGPSGEGGDSCFGFYGFNEAETEAKTALASCVEQSRIAFVARTTQPAWFTITP